MIDWTVATVQYYMIYPLARYPLGQRDIDRVDMIDP